MTILDPMILALLVGASLAVLALSFWCPFAFATVIILLNERFLGLLPYRFGDYDLVRGALGPGLLLSAIALQLVFRPGRFRSGLKGGGGSYLPVVLAVLGVVACSTLWGGMQIFDQSLRSLIFQPIVFSYYLLYLYLCFFAPDKRQIVRFLGVMVLAALVVGALMAIDARIFHEARFFQYASVSERVGLVRIVVFVTGMVWAFYYSLACADEERYPLRRNLLFALAALFLFGAIVFIQLDRQVMLSCFVTTAVAGLTMKTVRKALLAWVLALCILVIVASPDFSFEQSLVGSMMSVTASEAATRQSGIGIRLQAMEYYYEHFKKTYGLGFGVLGSRREYRNPVSQGMGRGYNLNDLSLAGMVFRFGIPGLLLIVFTAWKMFRDTGRILKSEDPSIRSVTRGLRFTLLHMVLIFPLTTFLFYEEKAVYFALMFFLVERLMSIVRAETATAEARWQT